MWNDTGEVKVINKIHEIVERLHGVILIWS